jgi:hypothetical protein
LLLVAYSVTNFMYNYNGLLLNKAGSEFKIGAVLCSIAYALKVPLTNALFTQRVFMGDQTEKFTIWNVIGLVTVSIGFVTYIYFTNQKPIFKLYEDSVKQPLLLEGASIQEPFVSPVLITSDLMTHDLELERGPWGFHDRVVGVVACGTISEPELSLAMESNGEIYLKTF